jgi:hypothetical protein
MQQLPLLLATWLKKSWMPVLANSINSLTKSHLTRMNKLVGITLGAAATYGIVRYLQMQNVSDKTNITLVEPRIHDINLAGLYIRTEVQVNNQTINSVQITKPVVSLKSKGVLLSQSNAENKLIFIKPLGITKIDTIELRIGWMSLARIVSNIVTRIPSVIKAFKTGNSKELSQKLGIPIEMSFSTYVNGLFYQSEPTKII